MPKEKREPDPARLAPDHPYFEQIMAAHDAAVASGQAMYRDPVSGLWVQTADSIWATRDCCDLGCRHCPFD